MYCVAYSVRPQARYSMRSRTGPFDSFVQTRFLREDLMCVQYAFVSRQSQIVSQSDRTIGDNGVHTNGVQTNGAKFTISWRRGKSCFTTHLNLNKLVLNGPYYDQLARFHDLYLFYSIHIYSILYIYIKYSKIDSIQNRYRYVQNRIDMYRS